MPERQDTGEPVLVAFAKNGDRDALEVLLRRYYRPIHAFITPMVGSSNADDGLEEMLPAIFQTSCASLTACPSFENVSIRKEHDDTHQPRSKEQASSNTRSPLPRERNAGTGSSLSWQLQPRSLRRFGWPSVLPVLSCTSRPLSASCSAACSLQ